MLDTQIDFEKLGAADVLTEEAKLILPERIKLWVNCELYPEVRAAAVRMCKFGTPECPPYLYFFRQFASIQELRNPPGLQKLPFVPYEYQVRELEVIHNAVQSGVGVAGRKSVVLWLKSRDMGMTWLVLTYFAWDFLFNDASFHIGSFTEDEVDTLKSSNSLFGKIRYLLGSLPTWMIPRGYSDKTLLLAYGKDDEGAQISGQAASPGFGRSKRAKAALLDEFQQWEHDRSAYQSIFNVCNCIFLLGTPNGYGNYYSEIANRKQVKAAIIRRVHWVEHPLKSVGLEQRDGKAWSPWYQRQLDNLPPEMVAAEIDLSFETSVKGPVFASSYGPAHQKTKLTIIPKIFICRSWDPGGWFAVAFMQKDRWGRIRIYKEIIHEGARLADVADEVMFTSEQLVRKGYTVEELGGTDWRDWAQFDDCGDPSGASTSKANQDVPEYGDLFEQYQINVDYLFMATMPTNMRVRARNLAIMNCMTRYITTGNSDNDGPGLWVDVNECPVLDEAFRGGYRRKTNELTGGVTDQIQERHPYVDIVDAVGYGVVKLLGVPEQIKREARRKSEDELEDERSDYQIGSGWKRSRC